MIEVLRSGPANLIHDRGRSGLLHLGVSRSGAMDRFALDLANALVGNARDAAAVEVAMFPFVVRFGAATRVALTGADCGATLNGRRLPPNWTIAVKEGDELAMTAPDTGARGYLGVAGGVDVPLVLGSRSTDLKSSFGGYQGRGLQKGDRLGVLAAPTRSVPAGGIGAALAADPVFGGGPVEIRVVPAAEEDRFTGDARRAFFSADWNVTHEANRMGYRLEGPRLALSEPVELLSHGLLPGVVQVPASGQPIIQLADANTCGGYPKIAVVIGADLWKIGQTGPGSVLRFRRAGVSEALEAERALTRQIEAVRADARMTAG